MLPSLVSVVGRVTVRTKPLNKQRSLVVDVVALRSAGLPATLAASGPANPPVSDCRRKLKAALLVGQVFSLRGIRPSKGQRVASLAGAVDLNPCGIGTEVELDPDLLKG